MKLNFTKMQGAGNDYIYIDCRAAGLPPDAAAWAVQLSRRHFSVGADGVIYLCPPLRADGDAAMRMFNADGSEGVMCGNGVRCVGKYVYDHGLVDKDKRTITVETLAGIKTLEQAPSSNSLFTSEASGSGFCHCFFSFRLE